MSFYLFILLFLFFLSLKGYNSRVMLLVLLLLSIIIGFRAETVGTDTSGYIDYYNSLSLDIFSGHMEKGWNFLAIVCRFLGLSAYTFHFVVALLTLWPIYYISIKSQNNHYIGYVVFLLYTLGFYFHMFNIMRQFLAISIVLMAYFYLCCGRKKLFVFWVVLASFIHTASLFALFQLFFNRIKMNLRRVLLILSTSFVVGIIASESFFLLFTGKYSHDIEEFGFRSGINYFLTVGLLTNLFTIWLYYSTPELRNNFWVRLNIFSVVIFNLVSNLVLGARLAYFYSICSIFAYSLYAVHSNKKIVSFVIYLFAIITFIRYLVPEILNSGMDGSLVPYAMELQLFKQ